MADGQQSSFKRMLVVAMVYLSQKRNWRIKRTQLNPNSDYVTVPTYFIPYSMADATMDCSNFFNQYELEIN